MRRRAIRRLLAAAIITLVSLAIVILALWRQGPVSSFQFLHGRTPVLHERFSGFSVTIYCFPGALDQILPEASTELASRGFAKSPYAELHLDVHKFVKQASNDFAEVIISRSKLLDETTATQYSYEYASGWVSVQITQSRIPWRYYLSRASRGLIPPPPYPAISRKFFGPGLDKTTRQSH